jgi:putative heme-binding domain-containing protein
VDLNQRARSYLHANCSICHVEAGGGNAKIELRFATDAERTNLIGHRPQHDTFGIDNAMLVAPGDPDRSILYHRVARRGSGQMPPLVTGVVDDAAVQLFYNWIKSLPPERPFVRDWALDDLLPHVDDLAAGRSFEAGRTAYQAAGCSQCHRLAGEGGSVGPDLTGIGRTMAARELLESLITPSQRIAPEYANTIVETSSGRLVEGRLEREDEQAIVLRPDPSSPPITIPQQDVEDRYPSPTSNMPTGTLNTLHLHEILDLLAFLIADGQSDHASFR